MARYYLIKRIDWDRGENLYLRVPSRGDFWEALYTQVSLQPLE